MIYNIIIIQILYYIFRKVLYLLLKMEFYDHKRNLNIKVVKNKIKTQKILF